MSDVRDSREPFAGLAGRRSGVSLPFRLLRLAPGALRVPMAVVALLVTVVTLAEVGYAQSEAFCQTCQATRWSSLEDQLLRRAANVKRARELLRKAEAGGRADLVQQAMAHLERTTTEWEYIDELARKLESGTYKMFLARHQVDVERRYDEARADLHRKTEQLNRLRQSFGAAKEAELTQMRALAAEEARLRTGLGINSAVGAIKGAGNKAEMSLRLLKAIPSGAIDWSDDIRRLERFVDVVKAVKLSKIGVDAVKGEYWKAAISASQTILALVIPTSLTSKHYVFMSAAASTQLARTMAFPFFVTLALDFAEIGLSHEQFREAEERLQSVGDLELSWQVRVQSLGQRVNYLRAERELAADATRRQEVLEAQVRKIREELGQ